MTMLLLAGGIGVILLILFGEPVRARLFGKHPQTSRLRKAAWFQNYRLAGMFVFLVNAGLFAAAAAALYAVSLLMIPYLYLVIMIGAVCVSFWFWTYVRRAWAGSKGGRIRLGFIGSSFYLLLVILFVWMLAVLKPSYPGEDTFMAAFGLVAGIFISLTAFIAGLWETAFRNLRG